MIPPTIDERPFRRASKSPAQILASMSPDELRAHLAALQAVTEAVLAHVELPDLLSRLLARLRDVLGVDTATVLLCTSGGTSLLVTASSGLEEEVERGIEIPIGQGIVGTAAVRRHALIVDDVSRVETVSPVIRRLASMMVAPLLVEGRLLGILHVGVLEPRIFGDAELHLLQVVADRVALAVRNARLYEEAQAQIRERERIEEALAESELRHRILAETAADAIVTIDSDSVIVSANPAAAEIFGYPLEQLHGMSMTELMPERHRRAHRAGVIRYLQTGERRLPWRRLELPGLHSSGREIILEVTFTERVTEERHLFTGTMRDITERRRTERILAAQYATTRVLAQAGSVEEAIPQFLEGICTAIGWDFGVFWSWDPARGALRADASWTAPAFPAGEFEAVTREITFASGTGLPGRVWESQAPAWIPDVTRDSNFPRLDAAARVGLHGAFAFPACVGSDCMGVMEFFSRQPADPDPTLLAAMDALGSDVGQFIRRREAEARAEAQERIQNFFGHVSVTLSASALDYDATLEKLARLAVPALGDWCMVYVRGEDGVIRRLEIAHADPALEPLARQLERYPVDPTGANPALRVLDTGESMLIPEIPEELVRRVAQDEEHLRLMRRLEMRSAMIVPLVARGHTLGALTVISSRPGRRYDQADVRVAEEFARRAGIALDNARLYRESQEANRAKGEFMATISHELRTPLNAVIGYADLLGLGVAEGASEQAGQYAQRIGVAARHLSQLIEEVLTFSRLEAGREELEVNAVAVGELLEEIRVIAEPLAAEKGLRLTVAVSDEPLEIATDARKLRQILVNLIGNAVKFTDEGEVAVEAERHADGGAVVRVRDTGIGIPPEHIERVFDPFWQVNQGMTRTAGGTGLGLTVTRRLVELLGGGIELDSSPGQGTTVSVRLPAAVPGADPAPPPGDAGPGG